MPRPSYTINVCPECEQQVGQGGHSHLEDGGWHNKGTREVEVIPRAVADELAEALEARPDDRTYGQFNADGSPKKALRITLALAKYRDA